MHRDVEIGDVGVPTLVKKDIVRLQIAMELLVAIAKKPARGMEVPTDGLSVARGGMQALKKSRRRSNAQFPLTESLVSPNELHGKGMISAFGIGGD